HSLAGGREKPSPCCLVYSSARPPNTVDAGGPRWPHSALIGGSPAPTTSVPAANDNAPRWPVSLPVCQVSLPRLANSVLFTSPSGSASCVEKKNEFASLPRFLSRGGLSQNPA